MSTTLLETLRKTTAFFEKKGVPQPKLSAEWLFAEALGCKRLDLYMRYEELLNDNVLNRLRPWVVRRAAREPWQYIVGHTPFLDITLKTDPRALIPRPETEELVATLVEANLPAPARILDLGTGSGAIALALAKAYPRASVVAVDASEDALSLARENAKALELDSQVVFLKSNWLQQVEGTFDWIISNPPYLTDEEVAAAEPEVRTFEPISALTAPDAGMADLKTILGQALTHLNSGGLIALEMGIHHGASLKTYADSLGYQNVRIRNDLSYRPRFLWAEKAGE